MSSNDIRLRLTIRRHGLPDVKLVWPCASSDDLTIANLLAQVNDVVTLESGQWGLEDYAVELADGQGPSFECLHFQQVGKVFKHDDQVLIRSLLTEDVRRRRISGRHQISNDGIHLVDGIPFGRRRGPRDRPHLELPPRKRARIDYDASEDEEDSEDEDEQTEQLMLEGPNHTNGDSDIDVFGVGISEDEDEDQDYNPGKDTNEDTLDRDDQEGDADDDMDDADLEEEIRLLKADNDIIGDEDLDEAKIDSDDLGDEELTKWHEKLKTSTRGKLGPQDPKSAETPFLLQRALVADEPTSITALLFAFPLTSIIHIKTAFEESNHVVQEAYKKLAEKNQPKMTIDELADGIFTGRFQRGPGEPLPALLPESTQHTPVGGPKPPLIQELDMGNISDNIPTTATRSPNPKPLFNDNSSLGGEVEASDDGTSASDSSSSSEEPTSDSGDSDDSVDLEDDDDGSENALNPGTGLQFDDDASSEAPFSDSDDAQSNSDSSESFEGLSVDGENKPHGQEDHAASPEHSSDSSSEEDSDSESSSDSSDESDSDSEPTEVGSKLRDGGSSDDSSSDSDFDMEPLEIKSLKAHVAESSRPKADLKPLEIKSLKAHIAEPLRPKAPSQTEGVDDNQGPGLSRTKKRNARRREAKRLKRLQDQKENQSNQDANDNSLETALLERKKALLSAVDDGAPEQEQQSNGSSSVPKVTSPNHGNDANQAADRSEPVETNKEQHADQPPKPTPESASSTKDDSARRRMRVDMGAGRRLLFGALGLKNPKNKADEEKLKENLMKDVRPLKNHRQSEAAGGPKEAEEPEEDAEDWREKIAYRAVECCHDGMVLSEPPFPFVQRWDPQQQFGSMRKRKRESQNHYQEENSYYGEDSYCYEDAVDEPSGNAQKSRKRKSKSNKSFGQLDDDAGDNIELNYDDTPAKSRAEDSQYTDIDDLPSLPPNVSSLPLVKLDEIRAGMVITWKQFQMSKATNWQPQVVSVTGLVLSIMDDSVLHVTLAKRDREVDERVYDEETGERIYDKFEVPDDSDGEDNEDDGHREVPWEDMMEPRVLQGEPPSSEVNSPVKANEVEDGRPGSPKPQDSVGITIDSLQGGSSFAMDLDDNGQHAAGSPSIPSGQNFSHFEISAPSVGGPTISDASRTEASEVQSARNSTKLESQQQHDSQVVIKDSQPAQERDGHGSVDQDAMDVDAVAATHDPSATRESESEDAFQDAAPSLDATSTSPQIGVEKQQALTAEYPQLPTSSVDSIRSGRQPQSDHGLGSSNNTINGTTIPETNLSEHETTPKPSDNGQEADDGSDRSSSPFPSLDEIWHTAKSSRQTQSPLKSSQPSALKKEKNTGDKDYEQAMLRLDDGEESEPSPDKNKSIRSLFPNATQPSPAVDHADMDDKKEVFARTRGKRQRRSSPFTIPEGSQVIALGSSPVSSHVQEEYAEDSVDDTYEDDGSSLPKGAGWVQKNRKSEDTTKKATRDRPTSVPAIPVTSIRSGKKSHPPSSSATTAAQVLGRRRMSRKF